MTNLDDTQAVLKIQGGDSVIRSVDNLPKQLADSFNQAQKVLIPEEFKQMSSILVCGMGGSRFPALIIKELFKDILIAPIELQDDYNPPAWVNGDTLVVLSSYSGTTEEVLTSGQKLLEKGVTKVIGISSGGELADILKKKNLPVYVFDPVHNPSGQPRIGVGYAVGGLLGMFCTLGVIKQDPEQISQAISALDKLSAGWKIDVTTDKNEAKQLAQKIHGRYPYYIVSEFLRGVGNAFANQTNETAKSISDFRIIPELNHHLMEGLKFPPELRKLALFIFIYSSLYSSRIQKRFKITKDVVEQNKIETLWHELKGKNKIEQALELLSLGSYMTMYLSTLYGQDPNAIPYVDYFKEQMKQ